MKTININGTNFTVEELNDLIENAKKTNPMAEVYAYHGTTEETFNELYKNIPNHIKAHAKEAMVVEFYNKGWKPDWNNGNEKKMVRLVGHGQFLVQRSRYYLTSCCIASRLCFKKESDLKEAVVKFFDVFKESRLN